MFTTAYVDVYNNYYKRCYGNDPDTDNITYPICFVAVLSYIWFPPLPRHQSISVLTELIQDKTQTNGTIRAALLLVIILECCKCRVIPIYLSIRITETVEIDAVHYKTLTEGYSSNKISPKVDISRQTCNVTA